MEEPGGDFVPVHLHWECPEGNDWRRARFLTFFLPSRDTREVAFLAEMIQDDSSIASRSHTSFLWDETMAKRRGHISSTDQILSATDQSILRIGDKDDEVEMVPDSIQLADAEPITGIEGILEDNKNTKEQGDWYDSDSSIEGSEQGVGYTQNPNLLVDEDDRMDDLRTEPRGDVQIGIQAEQGTIQ
ncbi:hypothetical protein Syun_029919 [Stephania yunnanensis]|uniref:Uncharacterized protein n=1 Tax=Stephania yunnanensis TaxID=152371 RepID=A0AAP0HLT6_9MAGN